MRSLFSRIPSLTICVFALSLAFLACERHEREQGGKDAVIGSPDYKAVENVSLVSHTSHVEEVAPKVGSSGPDGAALFAASCAACHQATGQGVPGAFPPLDGSVYVTSNNVERLASIMLYGLQGPITVKGVTYQNIMLPQSAMKDEELAAIANYIRNSWSNKAGGIEAAVFTKMRQKWGQRAQFTIEELGVEPGA